jgi:hypothetical protein
MRKNFWVSLTLLFVAYFTLGWKLSAFEVPLKVSVPVSITSILLLCAALSFPLRDTKALIMKWFSTDMGAFISIILGAFIAVIVVTWLHLFATCLVLISAGILARLDMQLSGYKKWRAFSLLATVSLTGLGLGKSVEILSTTGNFLLFGN